jgi:hypothetical protein
MSINQKELVQLLEDDIFKARRIFELDDYGDPAAEYALIQWGFEECKLDWLGGQTYFIIESTSDEISPGETISVDEILDIVL